MVAVFTVATIVKLNQTDKNALQVEVTGQQWWWSFHYDMDNNGSYTQTAKGDIITANEMVIPVNRQVALTITSNDVIHSFWIPALNGKKDAVPGQHHPLVIEANKIGVYRGQCTQFCGLSHANMRMVVRVVSQSDFAKWVANQQRRRPRRRPAPRPRPAPAVFKGQLCSSCHLIRGVNDAKIASRVGQEAAGLGRGARPHPHRHPRHLRRVGVQPVRPEQPQGSVACPAIPTTCRCPANPGDALFGGDSAPYRFNTTGPAGVDPQRPRRPARGGQPAHAGHAQPPPHRDADRPARRLPRDPEMIDARIDPQYPQSAVTESAHGTH